MALAELQDQPATAGVRAGASRGPLARRPASSRPVRWRPPLLLAAALAVGSGVLLAAAFPERSWWIAAPLGVAALHFALRGRSLRAGFGSATVAGATFWLLQLSWLTTYLGPVPWLALATAQTVFVAVAGVATTALLIAADRTWTPTGRILFVPLTAAGIWTGQELLAGAWPYGGFGWGRVAASQVDGPFAELLAWLGPGGTTFAVVWLSVFAVELACAPARGRAAAAALVAGFALTLSAVPPWTPTSGGELRLAAVQGGVDAGLFSGADPGDILRAHERATEAAGPVDLTIWPENASDLDPLASPDASARLDRVAHEAPLLVGTITDRGGELVNTSLLWEPGLGATDWYDKARLVPFGEYVPDRAFWRQLAPDLIDLVTRDYAPGVRDNALDVAGTRVGVGICFDVVDDGLVRDMVTDGAQLIVYQSNNADFGRTEQSAQQLGIARMRAIETGRTVVNVSTVGTTAIIRSDGTVTGSLPTWTSGALVGTVRLHGGVTPAVAFGERISGGLALLGVAGLVPSALVAARRRLEAVQA